jgi:predicted HNH restriction endonuclease
MVIKKCIVCNKEFSTKPCLIDKNKFCSKECYYKSQVGKKQPEEYVVKRALANTGKKRSEDFRLSQSLRQMGSNNSNYKHGLEGTKEYRREKSEKNRFVKTKDEWLEYFGGKCQLCGMSNYDSLLTYGKRLSIHHKDNKGRMVKIPNNEVDNLILLCCSCHRKEHFDSKRGKYLRESQLRKDKHGQ